jgi:hypothetical protein
VAASNSAQSIYVDPVGLQEIVSLLDGLPSDVLDIVSLLQTWIPAAGASIGSPTLRASLENYLAQWKNSLMASANGLADLNQTLRNAIPGYLASDQAAAKQMKNVSS